MLKFIILLSSLAFGWESLLFPRVGLEYVPRPVTVGDVTYELLDYSNIGYYLSEKPLGDVPCNIINIDATSGIITRDVQNAVNILIQNGGGVVKIPAGSFIVDESISIDGNNIAIEGAGSGLTNIRIPSHYNPTHGRNEGLFTFGIPINGFRQNWNEGDVLTDVPVALPRGSFQIVVTDSSQINVGQWVVVRQCFWEQLVLDNSNGSWPLSCTGSDRVFSFSFLRQVTSVLANAITVDAPIPRTLLPQNNRITVQAIRGAMRENVGISGLSLFFDNNFNGDNGRPGAAGVYFEGVRNGWASDIFIENIPRDGIFLRNSARISIVDCHVDGGQDLGDAGFGYAFQQMASQDILMHSCIGENTRHNFISQYAMVSMLVMSGCTSLDATQADDTHHSFSVEVVWDNHTMYRNALFGFNRATYSGDAYETLSSGVVWNFWGDGLSGQVFHGGEVHIAPGIGGSAMVVGTNELPDVYDDSHGNPFISGVLINTPEIQTGTTGKLNVLYEGVGRLGLEPKSLYDTQLQQRLKTRRIYFSDAKQFLMKTKCNI